VKLPDYLCRYKLKLTLMNKFLSALFLLLTLSSGMTAQGQQTQETAVQTLEYKAENPGWLVNLEEAFAISKSTGKPIMANFTGSDWCIWCKRLTADVFSKPEFQSWAKENVVLLEVDFPRMKKLPDNIMAQNASLKNAFEIPGFPTVWVFNLNKDEKLNQFSVELLGRTGYTKNVAEFTDGVTQMIKK